MVKVTAILGSVTPPGRLARVLSSAMDEAARAGHETTLVDLGQLDLGFADGTPLDRLDDDTPGFVQVVSDADAVLLATPIYRATLTGALKNALDLLPLETLRSKPVGIVSMGATLHHYMGAESHVRDILAWFGAVTAPTAVYLSSADFVDGEPSDAAVEALGQLVATLVQLATTGHSQGYGPPPLAAR